MARSTPATLAKQQLHYGSTGDWLTHTGGLRRGEGKRRVVRAEGADRTTDPNQGGLWSTGPCRRPRPTSSSPPSTTSRPGSCGRRRGEGAGRPAPAPRTPPLARAGRHVLEVVDPDTADRRLEAHLEREERAAHLDRLPHDHAPTVPVESGSGAAAPPKTAPSSKPPSSRSPAPTTTQTTQRATRRRGAGPAATRRPPVGRPRHHRPARPGHRPRPRTTHGTPARLLVTLDHHSLKDRPRGPRVGTTADGTELPPDVLRRLACDAEIIPAVLGTTRRGPRRRTCPTPRHPSRSGPP